MEGFASAVLVAAVRRALAEQAITVSVPTARGALVPLKDKRRMLNGIARTHGLLPLLRVGRSLPRLPAHPIVSALTAASNPQDLFARWRRMERFTHSHHRVVLHESSPTHIVAEHVGPPGSPPDPAEDILIVGLLTALLEAIGAHDLTVTLAPHRTAPVFADGDFLAPPPNHATAVWNFAWSSLVPATRATGLTDGSDTVWQARHVLTADPARRWTLEGLAARFQMSPRSLQRRLRADGGFSELLAAARGQAAAEMLTHTGHSLGVIGFSCGYADQPHFTREFKRHTAMTPAEYRSAFAFAHSARKVAV